MRLQPANADHGYGYTDPRCFIPWLIFFSFELELHVLLPVIAPDIHLLQPHKAQFNSFFDRIRGRVFLADRHQPVFYFGAGYWPLLPRFLAHSFIASLLSRRGYLPETRRAQLNLRWTRIITVV
jgi:hypothetical protein